MVVVDQDQVVRCNIKKLLRPAIYSPSDVTKNSAWHLSSDVSCSQICMHSSCCKDEWLECIQIRNFKLEPTSLNYISVLHSKSMQFVAGTWHVSREECPGARLFRSIRSMTASTRALNSTFLWCGICNLGDFGSAMRTNIFSYRGLDRAISCFSSGALN